MILPNDKPLTISIMLERVFSDEPILTRKTIEKWGALGIFRPESVRTGRAGSELSLSDAVAACVMHALFQFGASFHQVGVAEIGKTETGVPIYENPMGFKPLSFSQEDYNQISVINSDPRPIQRYLDYTDYKCYAAFEPKTGRVFVNDRHVQTRKGNILFFPDTDKNVDLHVVQPLRQFRLKAGVAFVNCSEWHHHVKKALGLP